MEKERSSRKMGPSPPHQSVEAIGVLLERLGPRDEEGQPADLPLPGELAPALLPVVGRRPFELFDLRFERLHGRDLLGDVDVVREGEEESVVVLALHGRGGRGRRAKGRLELLELERAHRGRGREGRRSGRRFVVGDGRGLDLRPDAFGLLAGRRRSIASGRRSVRARQRHRLRSQPLGERREPDSLGELGPLALQLAQARVELGGQVGVVCELAIEMAQGCVRLIERDEERLEVVRRWRGGHRGT
jgi:hypothetical protein